MLRGRGYWVGLVGVFAASLALSCQNPASPKPDEKTSKVEEDEEPEKVEKKSPAPLPRVELPPVTPLSSVTPPPLDQETVTKALSNPKAEVTAEVFESALLLVANCEHGWGDYFGCDQARAFRELSEGKNLFEGPTRLDRIRPAEIAARHLRHPSPAVRHHATKVVGREVSGSKAKQSLDSNLGRAILSALYSETDPKVLARLIDVLSDSGHKRFEIRKVILESLGHTDRDVRIAAVRALATQKTYFEVLDSRERLVKILLHDADQIVRKITCAELGKVNEPEVLEPIAKVMEDPASDPELRGACFEGVVRLWTDYPQPNQPSERAYRITMKVLTALPRNDHSPHNRGILALSSASGRYGEEWLDKVRGFYVKSDIQSALESIILDPKAAKLSRDVAVSVLGIWDEHASLVQLAAKLKSMPDADSKKLAEEALQKSKKR